MSNPVVWFEIYVDDLTRAKEFYEKLLGVTLTKMPNPHIEMWVFPNAPQNYGAHGALVKMEGFSAGANSIIIYFECQDCAQSAAHAVQLGGKLQKNKMSIGPNGHIALVVDTEGNMIGLHSMA